MRKIQKCASLFVIALLCCFGTACVTQMTGIAPSTTPITSEDTYTVIGHTTGHAWGMMLWFIPLFTPNPSLTATEHAIEKCGGDALIEVTEEYTMSYLFLITICRTRIEGTGVKIQRGGAAK